MAFKRYPRREDCVLFILERCEARSDKSCRRCDRTNRSFTARRKEERIWKRKSN
jgi:hypothetical protein